MKLYRLAAAQGNAFAQVSLGAMYGRGLGVPQNYSEAIRLYRLAVAQGDAYAQNNLGFMYQHGRGVPQNSSEAIRLYRLAAAQGNADAQASLRNMGVPQIYSEAVKKGEPEKISAQMHMEGGVYVVPVLINEAITLDFVVDSGAAAVIVPADVVLTLMRTGTLKPSDFLEQQTYVLADGSTLPSQTFRIRSLKVGNKILEDVKGSIGPVKGDLLLGQSFLGHFKSWSVDNDKHALVLE
jgi:predicted aspartyl protease